MDLTLDEHRKVAEVCDAFEADLQRGTSPSIARSAQRCPPPLRQTILLELIALEMDYVFRRTFSPIAGDAPDRGIAKREPSHLCLADGYAEQFPELQTPSLLAQLVCEEYAARHRAGDWPLYEEYVARFPSLAPTLRERFHQIDEQLTVDYPLAVISVFNHTMPVLTTNMRSQLEFGRQRDESHPYQRNASCIPTRIVIAPKQLRSVSRAQLLAHFDDAKSKLVLHNCSNVSSIEIEGHATLRPKQKQMLDLPVTAIIERVAIRFGPVSLANQP